MKELTFVEKITDRVWVAIIVWILLVLVARGLDQLELTGILWETITAALELIGIFLFIKALFKWFKKRKK